MRTRTNYVAVKAEEERGNEFKLMEHAVKMLFGDGRPFTKENILIFSPTIDEYYLESEEAIKYLKKKTSDAKKKAGMFNNAALKTLSNYYMREMENYLRAAITEMIEAEFEITKENISGLYENISIGYLNSNQADLIITSMTKTGDTIEEVVEVKAKRGNPNIAALGAVNNKSRSEKKYQDVKKAIDELLEAGEPVTKGAVSRRAKVSMSYFAAGTRQRELLDSYRIPQEKAKKQKKADNCKIAREAFEELKAAGAEVTYAIVAAKANVSTYYITCDEELCDKIKEYKKQMTNNEDVTDVKVVMESNKSKLDAVDIRFIKDIIDCLMIEQPAGIINLSDVAKMACFDLADIKNCAEIDNYLRKINVKLHTKRIVDRAIRQIAEMRKNGKMINIYTVVRENTDGIDVNFIKSHTEILEFIENNRSF